MEPPGTGPDATAVVQYPSGSTAEPGGVMISHRNLLHNVATMGEEFVLPPGASTTLRRRGSTCPGGGRPSTARNPSARTRWAEPRSGGPRGPAPQGAGPLCRLTAAKQTGESSSGQPVAHAPVPQRGRRGPRPRTPAHPRWSSPLRPPPGTLRRNFTHTTTSPTAYRADVHLPFREYRASTLPKGRVPHMSKVEC
ncbi:AMP-binding protein [Streptomyces sp. NPDC002779]|uniref:AMP-binding protein n=1 Tax=Streptomyces sp. NPDC002779 TaxID=3364664 RepID=UPI0036A62B95